MAISDEEIARAIDLFEAVGPITTRKMFGGVGLYVDGAIFSVIMSDGAVLLKGVGEMVERFEDLGMERWTYERPGRKPTAMPYWHLPESALDDPEEASELARDALRHL